MVVQVHCNSGLKSCSIPWEHGTHRYRDWNEELQRFSLWYLCFNWNYETNGFEAVD